MSRKNSCGVPLSYFIRKDTQSPADSKNRDVQTIYQASIVGNMFNIYSRKVIDILKELAFRNDAEKWIKGLNYGRKVMQELKYHYDGISDGSRRKNFSRADLNKIFYKNETHFTFEKYSTELKGISRCCKDILFHSTRSRLSSIY